VLTGSRLAIGIIWIVLVPAEMLGVQAGLGYFILDTCDRLAHDQLMAVVLGQLLDALARPASAGEPRPPERDVDESSPCGRLAGLREGSFLSGPVAASNTFQIPPDLWNRLKVCFRLKHDQISR
jgi:hypothetical protein